MNISYKNRNDELLERINAKSKNKYTVKYYKIDKKYAQIEMISNDGYSNKIISAFETEKIINYILCAIDNFLYQEGKI